MESVYVVHVQITDASIVSMDEGVSTSEVFTYVDSAPIVFAAKADLRKRSNVANRY